MILKGVNRWFDVYNDVIVEKDKLNGKVTSKCTEKNSPDIDVVACFEISYMPNVNKDAFLNDPVINKVAKYIGENYTSDITREEVARITYLSPSYFSTYFKSKTGITFYDYLLLFRISKAVEMLKDRKSTIDICESVGYSDTRFFSRKFKEFTSYTIAEYRKKFNSLN